MPLSSLIPLPSPAVPARLVGTGYSSGKCSTRSRPARTGPREAAHDRAWGTEGCRARTGAAAPNLTNYVRRREAGVSGQSACLVQLCA
jgi:hypothetical protein